MKAIILAAGRGSRMGSLTENLPKCRTIFFGKELIQWQLDAIEKAHIREVSIITGYLGHTFDFNVDYFHNPRWDHSNMVTTLTYAEPWLKSDDCIVSYSDIVFSDNALHELANSHSGDITILYDPDWMNLWMLRFEYPLEDAESFKIVDNIVVDVGRSVSNIEEIQGQYMGLFKITPGGWRVIMDYLKTLGPGEADRLDCTALLQGLITRGVPVHAHPCPDQWFEVDSEHDLQIYNRYANRKDIFRRLPCSGPHFRSD